MVDKIVVLAGGISSRMKEKPEHAENSLSGLYSEAKLGIKPCIYEIRILSTIQIITLLTIIMIA